MRSFLAILCQYVRTSQFAGLSEDAKQKGICWWTILLLLLADNKVFMTNGYSRCYKPVCVQRGVGSGGGRSEPVRSQIVLWKRKTPVDQTDCRLYRPVFLLQKQTTTRNPASFTLRVCVRLCVCVCVCVCMCVCVLYTVTGS